MPLLGDLVRHVRGTCASSDEAMDGNAAPHNDAAMDGCSSADRVATAASSGTGRGGGASISNMADADKAKAGGIVPRQGRRRRGRIAAALPYLILVAGMVVLMWPVLNSWIEAWQAEESIEEIVATYDEMSDPERVGLRAAARSYNEALATGGDLDALAPYEEQLSFQGSEMIAYVSIPKCSIRLPVYHGTEDRVLMAGVGHLKTSSLPAGGESSHCVLTAHTGIPGRRMFDDIHLLEPGDEFVVWVLGEPLAYRVYDTEVVLPNRVESLRVQQGRDLCTLITCTPYGVNSHRLLVHGERCAYVEGAGDFADLAVYINSRTLPLLIATGLVLVVVVLVLFRGARRRRRRGVTKAKR